MQIFVGPARKRSVSRPRPGSPGGRVTSRGELWSRRRAAVAPVAEDEPAGEDAPEGVAAPRRMAFRFDEEER